ncbi:beta-defensin 123-like [Crotalus tigris]|uniref:beta-defensin 123-like n=1 Tax=Crotalus tigris TaxID=88082 RepID=UPI00192F63C0|nr:beta-defensin 123-like [Crotalus tigris]
MKILHFFLAGLSVFLLISAGYASKKPKTTRECYSLNGTCRLRCKSKERKHGKCNHVRRCCIRSPFQRENPIADNSPFVF